MSRGGPSLVGSEVRLLFPSVSVSKRAEHIEMMNYCARSVECTLYVCYYCLVNKIMFWLSVRC